MDDLRQRVPCLTTCPAMSHIWKCTSKSRHLCLSRRSYDLLCHTVVERETYLSDWCLRSW